MKIVIYIDGKRVDVSDKVNLSLTYINNAFVSADKISNSHSNTISLPRTARNEAVFGCIVSPSSVTRMPYKHLPASVEIDGVAVVKSAIAYITEVTASEYKIAIVWDSAVQLAKMVEDEKQLNELDFTADNNADFVVWDSANVTANPSKFPDANYGIKRADGTMPTEAVNHPAVSVVEVLERICNQYGITPPPEEDTAQMEKWRIPLINRIDPIIKNSSYGYLNNYLEFAGDFAYLVNYGTDVKWVLLNTARGSNGQTPLPNNDIVSRDLYGDGAKDYSGYIADFVPFYDGCKLKLRGDMKFALAPTSTHTRERLMRIHMSVRAIGYANGNFDVDLARIEPFDARANVNGEGGYIHYKFEDVETDAVPSPLAENTNVIGAKMCSIMLWIWEDIVALATGSSYDGYLYIVHHREKVNVGDDLYIVPNLPDMKTIDYLKALATLTGRYITMEGEQMRLLSYDSYTSRANAYDWSKYVIGEPMQAMTFTHGEWARKNIFTFENEGDSALITIDNAMLDAESEVEVPFTTAPVKNFRSYIPLYEYDEGETEPTYNGGGGEAYLTIASNDYSALIGSPKMTEIVKNYNTLHSFLADMKVVRVQMALPTPVLASVDMTRPVYLEQFGCYFAITEMKTRNNGGADVELLKI